MSRVLLMVQNGDARPKCASWWQAPWARALLAVVNNDPFGSVQFHSLNKARKHADRWWLVECESAEAGRELILCDNGPACRCPSLGEILASGGKP